jgi:hypothetical protein
VTGCHGALEWRFETAAVECEWATRARQSRAIVQVNHGRIPLELL